MINFTQPTDISTVTTELAKVPKSDGALSWNATALAAINTQADTALTDYDPPTKAEMDAGHALLATPAQVNEQVDSALDTVIPGVPTAGSVNDAVKSLVDVKYLGPTGYSLSNVVLFSNDNEKTGTYAGYTKFKEMICPLTATIRIYFELKAGGNGETHYGRIYKNGVAFGTARSTDIEAYQTYSEDLAFAAGDLIQIYAHSTGGAPVVYIRNFRILGGWAKTFSNTLV